MPYTPDQLLALSNQLEKLAADEQEVDIPQPPSFEEDYLQWLKRTDKPAPSTKREMKAVRIPVPAPELSDDLFEKYKDEPLHIEEINNEKYEPSDEPEKIILDLDSMDKYDVDDGIKIAKDKKLDPKAKVRNRGTVCVPASSAKDKKDHFPINDADQARNALARVHQYSKAPPWYSGSLKSLQELVSRKVHSKYPSIGKDKKSKKSSTDHLLAKYAEVSAFLHIYQNYDNAATPVRDFAEAMRLSAERFAKDSNLDDPKERRTYDILLQQASLVLELVPDLETLDREISEGETDNEMPPSSNTIANTEYLLNKY